MLTCLLPILEPLKSRQVPTEVRQSKKERMVSEKKKKMKGTCSGTHWSRINKFVQKRNCWKILSILLVTDWTRKSLCKLVVPHFTILYFSTMHILWDRQSQYDVLLIYNSWLLTSKTSYWDCLLTGYLQCSHMSTLNFTWIVPSPSIYMTNCSTVSLL